MKLQWIKLTTVRIKMIFFFCLTIWKTTRSFSRSQVLNITRSSGATKSTVCSTSGERNHTDAELKPQQTNATLTIAAGTWRAIQLQKWLNVFLFLFFVTMKTAQPCWWTLEISLTYNHCKLLWIRVKSRKYEYKYKMMIFTVHLPLTQSHLNVNQLLVQKHTQTHRLQHGKCV